MADQQDLIRLQKPNGMYTSCKAKDLQIYASKGFTVVDEGQDEDVVLDETPTEDDDTTNEDDSVDEGE